MMGKARFDKLLEPSSIGGVRTKNRMLKTAADVWFDDEEYWSYYEAIARGGIGIINLGAVVVDWPIGTFEMTQLHIEDDKYIPFFSEFTRRIHKHGCPTFIQLMHAGPWHQKRRSGLQPVSSSSLTESELRSTFGSTYPFSMPYDVPRELTIAEIEEIKEKFVKAAERAQKAGFDGVEVNTANELLLNSFLSRAWNRRQDAYGCADMKSRTRFVVEIIGAIKERLGPDFPVSVIINGAEYGVKEGTTSEESQGFAQIFQQAGACAIHVRAHGYGAYRFVQHPEMAFYPEPPKPLEGILDGRRNGQGALVPLAAAIKKVVSIPVITVGRLDPKLGEKILREGKADFIGMTRRLMADPELPNKVASGRLEDITPCTACLHCLSLHMELQPLRCQVNTGLGRAQDYVIKQAAKKKKVVIVGGGPAGMEAARVAALRGHEVILYERGSKLGGLLPLAALVKGVEIEDLPALVRYLKTQITKLGVRIRLGKEVNPSVIEEIKPDVVILAAGGIPTVPEIPGINRRNVVILTDLDRILNVLLRLLGPRFTGWLSKFWMPIGKRVVVIGGTLHGCELAEFLVKRGRKVTIVDTAEELGTEIPLAKRPTLFGWLAQKGVTMMTEVKYEEITNKGLTIITKEGKGQTIEADTIMPALLLIPNTELLKTLEGKVPEIYSIGDCREPHLTIDAITDASRVARAI